MPVELLDRKNVVVFSGYRWWAQGGLIHSESPTGDYKTQTVRDTLERLKAINEMVGNSRTGEGGHRPDEIAAQNRYV